MSVRYYRRDGTPLPEGDLMWVEMEKLFRDQNYKRVAFTRLHTGYVVSTVWLGIDHSFGSGPPLIFETMVFPDEDWDSGKGLPEQDCDRYATEEEAIEGHKKMCEKWEYVESDL